MPIWAGKVVFGSGDVHVQAAYDDDGRDVLQFRQVPGSPDSFMPKDAPDLTITFASAKSLLWFINLAIEVYNEQKGRAPLLLSQPLDPRA
jgi:hypothetical protein